MSNIRAIAFYLPQYHPIPENDTWWGKGFTEWTNVVRGKPRFKGHYQPHLPADLGFYDLRLSETREEQAQLAKYYGIDGFCYYHYWFNGKKLIERPIEDVLHLQKPDFPFCLCWANETWSRRWDGQEESILIKQEYGNKDDEKEHIEYLINFFKDKRYIKINGQPLFLIYRAKGIPGIEELIVFWRKEVKKAGFNDLYIASVDSSWSRNWDPLPYGFNAAVEFQPAFTLFNTSKKKNSIINKIMKRFIHTKSVDKIIDYEEFVNKMLIRDYSFTKIFRCVTPGFDNTSRRDGLAASILHNSNPNIFKKWIGNVKNWTFENHQGDERLVFINAWNEWAEGNHLEPDKKYGKAFLEAVKESLQ